MSLIRLAFSRSELALARNNGATSAINSSLLADGKFMTKERRAHAARLHLLTARQVMAAGEGDHGDGGGLMLRVRPDSVAWVLRYTSPLGKRREMGLGQAQRNTVAQAGQALTAARDKAHEARELLRAGKDPIAEREAQRDTDRAADVARRAEQDRARWTLARCARDYHERVIETTKSPKYAAQWIAALEHHIPASVWSLPIAEVTAPALLAALTGVTPHERARNLTSQKLPETVSRMRQRLDAVFEDAAFHGCCTGNPAAAITRKLREAQGKRVKRNFKALPYREAPALFARVHTAVGVSARALEFAVLTAARTGEALTVERSEIDFAHAVWQVPAEKMKAGEPHTVYLSRQALAVLAGIRGLDPRWVFPSPTTKNGKVRPLSNMAMLSTLGRLSMRDETTVHGLARATFSTWAYETGAARPDVIEACLAHQEGDRVKAAYARTEFAEERRQLLAAWADYLMRAPAEVLEFKAA